MQLRGWLSRVLRVADPRSTERGSVSRSRLAGRARRRRLKYGSSPCGPLRVVIMGAGGFVGQASSRRLRASGVEVTTLTRSEVDLLADGAAARLASYLSPDATLLVTSARAPCKDVSMLLDNLRMMAAVIMAVKSCPVAHLVYISSDAVYKDSTSPLNEFSCAEPGSLHGVMHLTREVMLKNELSGLPGGFVRP